MFLLLKVGDEIFREEGDHAQFEADLPKEERGGSSWRSGRGVKAAQKKREAGFDREQEASEERESV